MRLAWLALCVACGRVDFDPLATLSSDAVVGDDVAMPDAPGPTKRYTLSNETTNPGALFEIDLSTGQLTELGPLPTTSDLLTGLAYWDSNTLYAASDAGNVFKITLSPFSTALVLSGQGDFSAIAFDHGTIVGVDEASGKLGRWTPGDPGFTELTNTVGPTTHGGDLTQTSDGTWWYIDNPTPQLYTLDLPSGVATAVGSPIVGVPGLITGLFHDDSDQLWVVMITNAVYPISKVTGQLGTPLTVCLACPTPYVLHSGDAAQTP